MAAAQTHSAADETLGAGGTAEAVEAQEGLAAAAAVDPTEATTTTPSTLGSPT